MMRTPILACCLVLAAALLAPVAAEAAGVSVEAASPADLDAAKDPYQDGVKAMNDGNYEVAVDKFRESYNIVASPNSQLMLGRALMKVHRPMDAYRELQNAVTRATELAATQTKYQKTAESARREMEDLKLELAFITVIPGTEVSIGGRKLSANDWGKPQPMVPGRTKIEIMASDGRTRERNLRLEPGDSRVITAEFSGTSSQVARSMDNGKAPVQQSSEESRGASSGPSTPLRTLGYVVGGVGLAGVVGFTGFTIYANSTFGTPTDDCTKTNGTTTCKKAVVNNGEFKGRWMGAGYALLGFGVVGLGLGTYLVLTGGASSTAPTTALGIGLGSVALTGTF